MTVLALGPPGRRGGQEREQYLVGLGEIQGALQGRPDSVRVTERIAGDHSQQEGCRHPDPVDLRDRAVKQGRERGRRSLLLVPSRPWPSEDLAEVLAGAVAGGTHPLRTFPPRSR
jgi:hypothetical protein